MRSYTHITIFAILATISMGAAHMGHFKAPIPFLNETSSVTGQPNPNKIDMECCLKHCPASTAEAVVDPNFIRGGICQEGCIPFYYNDTSVGKLEFQNCTTKCALTYEDAAGDKFLACAMNNECVTFAPIPGTCPAPEVDAETSLASLDGEWWQQYGHNKLWDCYPCQHIHEMKMVNDTKWCAQTVGPKGPVQAPCFSYTYSYDLYLEKGTKYFQQTWQLPNVEKGKQIDIFYVYMGSSHNETWYLLKATERYVVLVDCSYMSGWTNVGSILWVRPEVVLTEQEMTDIAAVYKKKLNWNFPDDFCADQHGKSECTEPPSKIPKEFTYTKFLPIQ